MKARIAKVLVDFDGPQVMLLSRSKQHVIAVAVRHGNLEMPFFCCHVYRHVWDKYVNGKADLKYLYLSAPNGRYYFFDYARVSVDNVVDMRMATPEEARNQSYWPKSGFFSSSHTASLTSRSQLFDLYSFKINGAWDASEFSAFHGRSAEIYSLVYILRNIDDMTAKIKANVLNWLWRGGGSYRGFFCSLEQALEEIMPPLRVKSISYASPGTIVMSGDESIFNSMKSSIDLYSDNFVRAEKAYKVIDGVLSGLHLKRATPGVELPSEFEQDKIRNDADIIVSAIGMGNAAKLFAACNGNTLVYAKLALAIHRRYKALHSFVQEGRVALT